MKKNKLNLSDLKVKSFVTSLNPATKEDVKGGVEVDGPTVVIRIPSINYCPTLPLNDCNILTYNVECPSDPIDECATRYCKAD